MVGIDNITRLVFSDDVRNNDKYENWVSTHWPHKYIQKSMQIYDNSKPKLETETAQQYKKRRYRTLTTLRNRYNHCGLECHNRDCELKRRSFYKFCSFDDQKN